MWRASTFQRLYKHQLHHTCFDQQEEVEGEEEGGGEREGGERKGEREGGRYFLRMCCVLSSLFWSNDLVASRVEWYSYFSDFYKVINIVSKMQLKI